MGAILMGSPGAAAVWQNARIGFSDLLPSHVAYPSASEAVAAGVMQADPDATFQPTRPVTGQEAVEVVARIQALADVR